MSKTTNRFLGVLGALGLVGVIVAGCAAPAHSDGPPPPFFQQIYQKLDDGRTVMCLYKVQTSGVYGGGPTMSCDWAGAIVHPTK
jgi:hypothetical protein